LFDFSNCAHGGKLKRAGRSRKFQSYSKIAGSP
jgi:hypothetical protein